MQSFSIWTEFAVLTARGSEHPTVMSLDTRMQKLQASRRGNQWHPREQTHVQTPSTIPILPAGTIGYLCTFVGVCVRCVNGVGGWVGHVRVHMWMGVMWSVCKRGSGDGMRVCVCVSECVCVSVCVWCVCGGVDEVLAIQ
jgi:hypothetical protein